MYSTYNIYKNYPQKLIYARKGDVQATGKPLDMCLYMFYTLFLSIIIISQPLYIGNHISLSLLQNGMTPLMTASFNGHVKVVRVLIRSQAQLNTQDGV